MNTIPTFQPSGLPYNSHPSGINDAGSSLTHGQRKSKPGILSPHGKLGAPPKISITSPGQPEPKNIKQKSIDLRGFRLKLHDCYQRYKSQTAADLEDYLVKTPGALDNSLNSVRCHGKIAPPEREKLLNQRDLINIAQEKPLASKNVDILHCKGSYVNNSQGVIKNELLKPENKFSWHVALPFYDGKKRM